MNAFAEGWRHCQPCVQPDTNSAFLQTVPENVPAPEAAPERQVTLETKGNRVAAGWSFADPFVAPREGRQSTSRPGTVAFREDFRFSVTIVRDDCFVNLLIFWCINLLIL